MKNALFSGLLAVGAAVAGLGIAPAGAVPINVDGYFYDLPAGSDKNLDAVRTLLTAGDAS